MKAYLAYLVLAPSALIASAALAGPVDNFASADLGAARYAAAIERLEPMLRADPADETVALNLAYAYRHLGRVEDARRLYSRVLNRDNVEVDTAQGPQWSHAIARAGLSSAIQLTSR